MLKKLYELAIQLITLSQDTQQNKTEIKELRQEVQELRREAADRRQDAILLQREVSDLRKEIGELCQDAKEQQQEFKELTRAVQHLAFEFQQARVNEAHEREKMVLRLENELLRSRPILPPASPEPEPEGK